MFDEISHDGKVDPTSSPPQLSGAAVVVGALADEQVEFIWGYPGGSVLYIYDELYKQDKIEFRPARSACVS